MIYFTVIFICSFCVILYDNKRLVSGRNFFFYLLLVCAILIAGLRNGIGGDTIRYMEHFETYPVLSEISINTFIGIKFEPLWILTNSLLKTLSFDFYGFQIVHSIFVNTVFFFFFRKYSIFPFLSILIYFIVFYFYLNTEILRESVAIAFFLISIRYLTNKMWLKFSLCIMIASLFHVSALFLFVIPFFIRQRKSFVNILLYLIFSLVVIQVFTYIVLNLTSGVGLLSRSSAYLEKFNWESALKSLFFFYLIPVIIFLYFRNKYKIQEIHSELDVFIMPYFFIASLTVGSPGIAGRLINYMMPILFIYVSYMLVFNLKVKLNLLLLLLIILPGFRTYRAYFTDTSYVVSGKKRYFVWYPYRTFITKDNQEDRNLFNLRRYYSIKKMDLDKHK